MDRDEALLRGFAILGLGLLVTIGSCALSSSGGMYIVASGAIITGIVRIVRAVRMPAPRMPAPVEDSSARERQMPATDDDERFSPSERIQIAGKRCAECETRILDEREGKVCKRCRAIVHRTCATDHKRTKHARRASTVYRG
jgi:hypothetical protein